MDATYVYIYTYTHAYNDYHLQSCHAPQKTADAGHASRAPHKKNLRDWTHICTYTYIYTHTYIERLYKYIYTYIKKKKHL